MTERVRELTELKKTLTIYKALCVCVLVAQLCPTICDPIDYSLSGYSVHGISQGRILELVTISFCKGPSQPRDQTCVSCIAGSVFTN